MAGESPEGLGKRSRRLKELCTGSAPHDPTFLDYVKDLTGLFNSVAWPAAVIYCVILFRPQLINFLRNVDTVKVFGEEISRRINSQIEQSAKEAQARTETELVSGPSKSEINRAIVVKNLVAGSNGGEIAAQAEALAVEYQQVRDSMLPGKERTRAMEVVVSKMRTIGQAFFPIRHEFAG